MPDSLTMGGREAGRGTVTRLLIHLWCVSQSLDGVFAVPYSFWMTKWAECGLQMHGSIMLHMWTHLSGTKSEKKSWKRWAFLFEAVPWFNTETHNYIEHNYIELIQGFVVVSIDYIIGLAHSPLPPDSKHTTTKAASSLGNSKDGQTFNKETSTLLNWSLKPCKKKNQSGPEVY